MWFEEPDMYFWHIENIAYGEINERSFSNPHPRFATTRSTVITSNNTVVTRDMWHPGGDKTKVALFPCINPF